MPNINALIVAWWGQWWGQYNWPGYWWGWWGWWGWVISQAMNIAVWANAVVVWWWSANSSFNWQIAIAWWNWWSWWNNQWAWFAWGVWWSWGWGWSSFTNYRFAWWWAWTAWQWNSWWGGYWQWTYNWAWWGWAWAVWQGTWVPGNWWNWIQNSITWVATYYGWGWAWGLWNDATWVWWLGWWWTATSNWTANTWGWWWWGNWNWVWHLWWSWVVIISYATNWSSWINSSLTTWWIKSVSWTNTIHKFTASWTFNVVASLAPSISNIANIYETNNIATSTDLSTYASYVTYPISWYTLSWTLPAWISFNSNTWVLSWTSTATWTYPLIFSATNSIWTTNSNTFNLIVNAPTPPIMWSVWDILTNTWNNVNKIFTSYVTQTNIDPILSYTLTWVLPLWLSFNSTTWLLSWNPLQTWTYALWIQASDKDWLSNTSNFNLIVTQWVIKYNESWFFDLIANSFN